MADIKKIAVVTMVYNEPEYLRIWCSYYGNIFGPERCYIIDHGSDDGSLVGYSEFNVCRIPRSPKDNVKRTNYVSAFCNALLTWYDAFIYTDVDEILIAANNKNLLEYLSSLETGTYSACGFDVHHDIETEADLELHKPVTWQRNWVRFSSSMCKVVISSKPIEWIAGFHAAKAPLNFAKLYLFHLRYFDHLIGLRRLARTRAMQWSDPKSGAHQRVEDSEFTELVTKVARLPKFTEDFFFDSPRIQGYISKVKASEKDYRTSVYNIDLHIFGEELLQIPNDILGDF